SYHSGKWHFEPVHKLSTGFDQSYHVEYLNRYFTPTEHYLNDVRLPAVAAGTGYYATTAIAQRAIDFLADHATNHRGRPFFLYLAASAPHFPLHALPEDIVRYTNSYLAGWDVIRAQRWERLVANGILNCGLSPLDSNLDPRNIDAASRNIPNEVTRAYPWASLTPDQQRFQATKMALHAAMVDRLDREIGRVFDQVRAMGVWDNTLIVFVSDNGASAEMLVRGDGHDTNASSGSARSHLCLGPGWSSAANAPFRRHKIWTHEGGISTPCILHWPARIQSGNALRHTPAHLIDLVPTVLELAGLTPPASWNGQLRPPLPGVSLAPAFQNDTTLPRETMFWLHEGNRALRMGDWKIVSETENGNRWELYNLAADRSEQNDLATQDPARVTVMSQRWNQMSAEMADISGGASSQ
ncbi:MAG: sulfatase-like hydrolase/transferase, partial [Verrucomicrobiales bacterium]|nr:sulfatase-like hydrolase/transferase [Verrucomicrobiales bacterium]